MHASTRYYYLWTSDYGHQCAMCVTPCVCLLQPVNSWLSSTWVCRLKLTHTHCAICTQCTLIHAMHLVSLLNESCCCHRSLSRRQSWYKKDRIAPRPTSSMAMAIACNKDGDRASSVHPICLPVSTLELTHDANNFHYLQKSGFLNIMLFNTSIHVHICMCVCIHVSVWGSLRLTLMIDIVAFSHLLQYN